MNWWRSGMLQQCYSDLHTVSGQEKDRTLWQVVVQCVVNTQRHWGHGDDDDDDYDDKLGTSANHLVIYRITSDIVAAAKQ